jgi:hypothetical protein
MDSICPPLRWNIVEVGISRGGYPLLRNFRHLSRMRLKTIVSLIPEPQSADLVEFAKMAGIELIYIQVRTVLILHYDRVKSYQHLVEAILTTSVISYYSAIRRLITVDRSRILVS